MPITTIRRVQTVRRTMGAVCRLVDPDYDKDKNWVVEYDFSAQGGDKFWGNPQRRGIYTPDEDEE